MSVFPSRTVALLFLISACDRTEERRAPIVDPGTVPMFWPRDGVDAAVSAPADARPDSTASLIRGPGYVGPPPALTGTPRIERSCTSGRVVVPRRGATITTRIVLDTDDSAVVRESLFALPDRTSPRRASADHLRQARALANDLWNEPPAPQPQSTEGGGCTLRIDTRENLPRYWSIPGHSSPAIRALDTLLTQIERNAR